MIQLRHVVAERKVLTVTGSDMLRQQLGASLDRALALVDDATSTIDGKVVAAVSTLDAKVVAASATIDAREATLDGKVAAGEAAKTAAQAFAGTSQQQADRAVGAAAKLDRPDLAELRATIASQSSAIKYVEGAGANANPSIYQNVAWVQGTTYVVECLAKEAGRSILNLISVGGETRFNTFFNLAAGSARAADGGTATVTPLGNGWFWCRLERTATVTTTQLLQLRVTPDGTNFTYTGDGASGVLLPYADLRVKGAAASLLASPLLSDPTWTKRAATAVTVAVTSEPVGPKVAAVRADLDALTIAPTPLKMTEDGANSEHRTFRSVNFATGKAYRLWAIVKAAGRSKCKLYAFVSVNGAGLLMDATFDLLTGTATGAGATITPRGNGEYLIEARAIATAAGTMNAQLRMMNAAGATSYVGDGASGIHLLSAGWAEDGVPVGGSDAATLQSTAWTKGGVALAPSTIKFASEVQRLAAEAVATAVPATPRPLAGKKLALVGTSLVVQGRLTSALASASGAAVQQLGYSGGALGLDARSSPHYGSGQVTALFSQIAADAQMILLDMLVNDVAASDVPIGTVTDTTPATYCGALANFFNWCEVNRPNAAVVTVVQTAAAPDYPTSDYRHGVANANGAKLEDFQAAHRRMCDYYGRPYIDPNRFGVGFLDMETGEDTTDGLHWDDSGAAKVARIYAKQLADLVEAGWGSL